MFIQLMRTSPFTGKVNTLILPISPDTYDSCHAAWQGGKMIQDAFPMLTADEREFIQTGITPDEWTATFGSDEDAEDTKTAAVRTSEVLSKAADELLAAEEYYRSEGYTDPDMIDAFVERDMEINK